MKEESLNKPARWELVNEAIYWNDAVAWLKRHFRLTGSQFRCDICRMALPFGTQCYVEHDILTKLKSRLNAVTIPRQKQLVLGNYRLVCGRCFLHGHELGTLHKVVLNEVKNPYV